MYRESGIEAKIEGLARAVAAAEGLPEEGRLRVELAEARALLPAPADRRPASVGAAAPCVAKWSVMTGDERVRFCVGCEKHVYNVSAMSPTQADAFLAEAPTPRVSFYRRDDGTILIGDCPQGIRRRRSMWATGSAAVVMVVMLVMGAYILNGLLQERDCMGAVIEKPQSAFSAIECW